MKKQTSIFFTIGLILLAGSFITFFDDIVCFIFPPGATIDRNANIDTLKLLSVIIGGYLLIWQIVLTNRRTKAAERAADAATDNANAALNTSQAATENAKATLENIKVIGKGQIQERFKNAIDQLGSDKEAVNLGAIYTLHHIAKESAELKKSVFDILCAYIRETTVEKDYTHKEQPAIKIQSILNLLFTDVAERTIYSEFNADLHGAYLFGANLNGANLNDANLWQAKLMNAKLPEAKLCGAYLLEANLIGAVLDRAILTEAILYKANLLGASFYKATLTGATFDRSRVGIPAWITNLLDKWHCIGMEAIVSKYYVSEEEEEGERVFVIREK